MGFLAGLTLGCGPSKGKPGDGSATGSATDDTGMPAGCGDGEPESGVFCFERVDVPELGNVSGIIAVDSDNAAQELMLCAGPSPGTLHYARVVDGAVDVVGSDLPCKLSSHGSAKFDGHFGPDLGTEVALPTRDTLRFHRRIGDEIDVREEPRACGSYDPSFCNYPIAAADITGDGVAEVVAFDEAPESPPDLYAAPVLMERVAGEWVLSGPVMTGFQTLWSGSFAAVADLDADASPEIVVAGNLDGAYKHADYDPAKHEIVVTRAQAGAFVEHWRGPAGTVPEQIALGDLDGDGHLDLVVRSRTAVAALQGTGDGGFAAPSILELAGYDLASGGTDSITGIVVGDFDGSGSDAEIGISVGSSPTVDGRYRDVVLLPDPLSGPTTMTKIIDGLGAGDLTSADLTGDGVSDLAFRRSSDDAGSLTVMLARP